MNNPMNAPLPSIFDPTSFMQDVVEGVGSTTLTPIPAGEYLALIGQGDKDVNPVPFQDKNTNEQRLRLDITFELVDDSGAIRAAIDGRDPKLTQGFFIDLIPNTFRLDMSKGKNVQLNRLREAVGQNTGSGWSPPMLRGAGPLKISVIVEPDKQDREVLRNKIKSFGKPA